MCKIQQNTLIQTSENTSQDLKTDVNWNDKFWKNKERWTDHRSNGNKTLNNKKYKMLNMYP